ncbi:nucleoside 2-deoxyribosyltransferase domain-containing protein [Actinoplanes sp. NPDC026623]|uniref:nucleoside 2-deoxyribosyltransferase domain-containing protein n=1 Tax=Actinoplanes sp. NPDC026623 TaxID=3155610 RepID=UPI0033F3C09D
MTVVVAPDRPASPLRPGIFLAGGISGVADWQRDAIEHLRPAWPVVYNPRRAVFPMGDDAEGARQIRWEFDLLAFADAILFWFSFETTQPIVLYELGRWAASDKPLAVGADPSYERRFDVVQQLGLARPGLTVQADLGSACAAANRLPGARSSQGAR